MRKRIEIITCDVCGRTIETKAQRLSVPVIFHTEQNEGRWSEPYISMEELDLCENCVMKVTNIHATGAQGDNQYKFQLPEVE